MGRGAGAGSGTAGFWPGGRSEVGACPGWYAVEEEGTVTASGATDGLAAGTGARTVAVCCGVSTGAGAEAPGGGNYAAGIEPRETCLTGAVATTPPVPAPAVEDGAWATAIPPGASPPGRRSGCPACTA